MNTQPATLIAATPDAKPRVCGFPVLLATLHESRALTGAACMYTLIIGLLVGLIFPALKTLNLATYLSNGTVGSLLGVSSQGHLSTFASYLAIELYSSFFVLLFGGVLGYAAGASIARNIEDGTIDLTLARPVSRTRFYLEKWGAILISSLMIIATSLLTGWLDTLLFANATLDWHWFLLAHLDIASTFFFIAGVGLLVSAVMSAGRAAGGLVTLIIVFGYLAQTFGTASDRLSLLQYLSPYYYAPTAQVMLTEQFGAIWKPLILTGAGLIAGLGGLWRFQRRDITP
jgi:ABC-2 type transport system permease protein